MPIQNTDLMVVQQGTTPYKVSAQTLRTYFQTGVTLNAATAAVLLRLLHVFAHEAEGEAGTTGSQELW